MAPEVEFRDPPLARRLFGTPGFGWLWLPVRVYLGYEWLQAGLMPESHSGRGRWVDCPPAQVNGRRGMWYNSSDKEKGDTRGVFAKTSGKEPIYRC